MTAFEKALGLLAVLFILWMVLLVLCFASMVVPPLSPAKWWAEYRGMLDGEAKVNVGFGLMVILTGVGIMARRSLAARTKSSKNAEKDEI